jgi:hypothetical protein
LGTFAYGGHQDFEDQGGLVDHVLPAEPEHQPARHDEAVVAPRIVFVGFREPVPGELIGLEHVATADIHQIGAAQQRVAADRDLWLDVKSRLDRQRPEH